MKKKRIKQIGIFFLIMLTFTMLSRGVKGSLIPKVEIDKVKSQVIKKTLTSQGTISYQNEVPVMAPIDLAIKNLAVAEGQLIEKNQLLFTVDKQSLEKKVANLESEIKKLNLQKQEAIDKESVTNQNKQRAIARAKEAYEEVIRAENQLIAKAKQELEDTKNQGSNNASSENSSEDQGQSIKEKQLAYDAAQASSTKNINDARRTYQQEEDKVASSTEASQLAVDIESKQSELDELAQLVANEGAVYSKCDGIVSKINSKDGEATLSNAVLLIGAQEEKARITLQFPKEQREYLHNGSEVNLTKNGDPSEKKTTGKIVSVNNDEKNNELLNVIVEVPSEGNVLGDSVQAEISVSENKHDQCIPISALHLAEGDKYFVYILEDIETPMGTEKIAKKTDVEVVEKNSQYAALKKITTGKTIITQTDKEMEDGAKVRIK